MSLVFKDRKALNNIHMHMPVLVGGRRTSIIEELLSSGDSKSFETETETRVRKAVESFMMEEEFKDLLLILDAYNPAQSEHYMCEASTYEIFKKVYDRLIFMGFTHRQITN